MFVMRLASHLHKTRHELLAAMPDGDELTLWMAYFGLEPPQDGYWQTGVVASTIANVMGSGKRKYKPTDFMPQTPLTKPVKDDVDHIKSQFAALAVEAEEDEKQKRLRRQPRA